MLLVESEHDDIIPPEVIKSYRAAFTQARSLTYRCIEGADHGLSDETSQRIYTGNVASGEHKIEVTIAGKLDTGKEYSRTEHFAFSKGVEPKLLGVTLEGAIG